MDLWNANKIPIPIPIDKLSAQNCITGQPEVLFEDHH
jgi:hypothetical protein